MQAEDEFVSAVDANHMRPQMQEGSLRERITSDVLRHPNINDTGRLPSFCLFHIGQTIRFTQTVEAGLVSVDQTGVIVGIDFDEREPVENKEALNLLDRPVVLLRHLPVAVYVKLARDEDDPRRLSFLPDKPCDRHGASGADAGCPACEIGSDIVAVAPLKNRSAWSLHLKSLDAAVKVKRRQLPFVCASGSTEHVLQGSTCDPGLLFHWKFPRRMGWDMRWLAVYHASL